MYYCDFSSVAAVLMGHTGLMNKTNQLEFLQDRLFCDYCTDYKPDYYFNHPSDVCSGKLNLSADLRRYYQKGTNNVNLENNIAENIVPALYDVDAVIRGLKNLVENDVDWSWEKKKVILKVLSESDMEKEKMLAKLICNVLIAVFEREPIPRDKKRNELILAGRLSPAAETVLWGTKIDRPCRWFCGRDDELKELHECIMENRHLFVSGIPGIGKSELLKKYAEKYKKNYQNIIYISHKDSFYQDILELRHKDDYSCKTQKKRYERHNDFLHSLQMDSLVIIDNCKTIDWEDGTLHEILTYNCHVVIVTRCRCENYPVYTLREMTDDQLLQLICFFYPKAKEHMQAVSDIISAVHRHTLAVELVARVLRCSIKEPEELFLILKSRNADMCVDEIDCVQDGREQTDTYYGHIHTLFGFFHFGKEKQRHLRRLALFPSEGIYSKDYARWLELDSLRPINQLYRTGLVSMSDELFFKLQPMIREVIMTDLKPSVRNCKDLLEGIKRICIQHGRCEEDYVSVAGTIRQILKEIKNDDDRAYLDFLEEVWPYLDNYGNEEGMAAVVDEMTRLIRCSDKANERDRLLLNSFRKSAGRTYEELLESYIQCNQKIGELSEENAALMANQLNNIGLLFMENKDYLRAEDCFDKCAWLYQLHSIERNHDYFNLMYNKAFLLVLKRECDDALCIMRMLEWEIDETFFNYHEVQFLIAEIYKIKGDICKAREHEYLAYRSAAIAYCNSPEMLNKIFGNKFGEIF